MRLDGTLRGFNSYDEAHVDIGHNIEIVLKAETRGNIASPRDRHYFFSQVLFQRHVKLSTLKPDYIRCGVDLSWETYPSLPFDRDQWNYLETDDEEEKSLSLVRMLNLDGVLRLH